MTTDTPSSRDEEIPTPLSGEWRFNNGVLCCGTLRIARPDFDTNPSHEFKTQLFKWLTDTLNNAVRLSAEREKEGLVANRDVPTLFPTLQHEIESLRATLAERDNQLADERLNYGAQVACIQGLENELAEVKAKLSEYKRREQSQFESEQEGDMEK